MTAYIAVGNKYARDVADGKILACKWVRLACKRHLDDLKRPDFAYRFDDAKAARACKFIELMPHTKGKWAAKGERLKLEPWQVFMVICIFGWVRVSSGMRRYRRAMLLVPRKNGKSAFAAAVGLYMLAADGEFGAEVYSGATSEKQAWEVFRPARIMAQRNEALREHFGIEVNASNINILRDSSRFEPVVGKPGDGASPSCSIVDEYHEHATDELLDTMETGMGAREQPLSLIITTAGDNMAGPCYALQLEAQRVLEGVTENDEFFALIYGIDPDDDWTSEAALRKANPNYDVSVAGDFLAMRQREAVSNARKQGIFQTKHLNVWVGAREAYFNVQKWRECEVDGLKLDDFAGEECIIGLDLASKVDIAALEILFPLSGGRYARFGKYYLPEATVQAGENEHYQGWALEKRLTVTDGEIIDFEQIKADILDLSSRFTVREVAYDPHQATMLVTALMGEGVPCIEFRPTVLNFSEPMKTLDGLIRAGQISHDGDPVMTWMISNVVAKEDAKDNVYPRKERPENKIDGVVALIMALGRAMQGEGGGDVSGFLANPVFG
jgi:phage terminase large subunit-like protein